MGSSPCGHRESDMTEHTRKQRTRVLSESESHSVVSDSFRSPWTVVRGISRPEYWSG